MATISINISPKEQHIFSMSKEKVQYLLKFINAISDEKEDKQAIEEDNLLQQIEKGLKDANKIIKGELPRKTIKEMLTKTSLNQIW